MKVLIKKARLIDPCLGLDEEKDLLISEGKIAEIGTDISVDGAVEVIEARDKILMPAGLDLHAHLREPGFEYKETVLSGSWAAVKGGYSALTCMPNTNPVADKASVIEYILNKAQEAPVKLYPFGAVTKGQKGQEMADISEMSGLGVLAFSDDGHGVQDSGVLRKAMDYAKMHDSLIVSHCEEESLSAGCVHEGIASTLLGILGQPGQAESIAVNRDIELARLTGARLHVCHLSSGDSVEFVRRAKKEGLSVSAEVTPHHIYFNEEDIGEYDTNKKINPPLRSRIDQKALIEGIVDGTIDCIATDHAPHASLEKELEFELAAYGSIGLETAMPAIYTALVDTNLIDWSRFVELFACNPRKILKSEKVSLEVGSPADICIFDPNGTTEVKIEKIISRSHNSAFLSHTLKGAVDTLLVDGIVKMKEGELIYD